MAGSAICIWAPEVDNLSATGRGAEEHGFPQTYREQRRLYYNCFPSFWGTFPGQRTEEYAIYGALAVSQEQARILRTAASRLYQLLTRLARVLQQADDQVLLDLGIPSAALPYSRTVLPDMEAIMCGRFEFAMMAEGPKLLEFNAETPTFVVELFHMNSQICADFGLADPNRHCQEQLARAIQASIDAGRSWLEPQLEREISVVFSSYADYREDQGTAEFYRSLLESQAQGSLPYRTSYRGLHELRVTPDCLLTKDGERVDILYKLYPTEQLIEDKAADGTLVGLALTDLVRKRRLAIINPPISFVMQNKALLAVLWATHLVHSALFTPEEHLWIEQYMLPTFLDANDGQGKPIFVGPYVIKPVYGREGDSVMIRNGHEIVEQSGQSFYNEQVMIYQQYAALPTAVIQTENGFTEVNLVYNCFIAGGVASAIGIRASRKLIMDDFSYFLPVCFS